MRNKWTAAQQRFIDAKLKSLIKAYESPDNYDSLAETLYIWGRKHHGRAAAGVYRQAIVFKTAGVVFKVSKYNQEHKKKTTLHTETEFIQKMRTSPLFGRHFPLTEIRETEAGPVQIQEMVRAKHPRGMYGHVERLGESLGIEDIHHGNFGWLGPVKNPYPVFIDLDFRNERLALSLLKPKKQAKNHVPSWVRVAHQLEALAA